MSDTSTTEATVTVARGELVLATVSEENHDWPGPVPTDRTFYVTPHPHTPDSYVTLVVPDHDDRSRGMWSLYPGDYGLTLDEPHKGWNVERRYVLPYDAPTPPETPAPVARPFTVGDRIVQSGPHYIANGYTDREYRESPNGIGSTGVVESLDTTYGADVAVRVQWDGSDRYSRSVIATDSIRHADDESNTTGDALVSDALTSPRFSREDVDRLVREAREAAKREASQMLEDFKEAANARAVEYAEQNGLCSEFERCMEDIGLLGREEWHDANDDTYRVTFTVSVDVTARDEDHAEVRARDELYDAMEYGSIRNSIEHKYTTVLD